MLRQSFQGLESGFKPLIFGEQNESYFCLILKIDTMNSLILEVENIKCGGCANGIKQKLQKADSSAVVDVDVEHGVVKITSVLTVDKDTYSDILRQMGYPEVGEGNLVTTAKSYVSCMIGKMS